ncbi:NACHT domain-containing protein [Streptomyces sp. NPDC054855]
MDPAAIGSVTRLASSVVTPLVKRLFVREGPGAGLVENPVRLSGLVSFRGEKRKLTDKDLARLAAELVRQAVRASGESAVPADEEQAVVDALARTLHALGDLTLTDVQAVELGHNALALRLRRASGNPDRDLSADAAYFYDRLLDTTCLHILHFFTQRSAFVARTLVEQSRRQSELITKIDELIARNPLPGAEDVAFEQRYLAYVAKKHGKLTIFGIDLTRTPGKWPLDAAYMSLEATDRAQAARLTYSPGYAEGLWDAPTAPTPRPADQSLAEHDRVLLRGEAGSGKTTLVQWLAVSSARPAPDDDRMTYLYDRIPYVLPLRTLTRHGERLPAPADFLSAVGSPLAGTQPKGWESRVLTAGRALILVDGIDEIPESERARTRAWLTDLIDAHPGNRWLVTSRPSAVREDWLAEEGFTELTLSAMGRKEVATFISRWHGAAATGVPEEDDALASYEAQLLRAVSAKPDLGQLATNPLMCGLICALHRDRRGFLPLSRKDLYTHALSMLLVRRDRERDMGIPEVREEPQLQVLQRLAYWLIRNGRTEMDRSRATTVIADALPSVPELTDLGDAQAVYAHFLHRSGLLREPAPGTVDFIHRTFQDFLGARAVVDEGDFGLLVRQAADDQWADVIRMAVAQARPRERAEIFRDLIELGDAHTDVRAQTKIHLMAAACLEHAAELAPDVRREVERRTAALIPPRSTKEARELAAVGPMVLDLLPGPDALSEDEARHVAVTATHVASDAAIPFLARLARHPSQQVRSQLMWGWGRYEARPYAEQVITRLDDGRTHFTLLSDAQVRELERLGLRPKHLDIRDSVSPEAASRLIASCTPTSLALEIPPDRLTPEALDGLRCLQSLRFLDLSLAAESWSLAPIPAEAPLRTLGVVGSWYGLIDAHRMRRWRELTWLIFGTDGGPSTAADWQTLEDLPRLERLSLTPSVLTHAIPPLRLPAVKELILTSTNGWRGATSHLAEIFPAVTRLQVVTRPGEETMDLSAVALPPTLRHVIVPDFQVSGLDAIPAGVEVDIYPASVD